MIINGTIQTLLIQESSLDEDGDPIPVEEVWSEAIPCHIKTIKHDYKGIYTDGNFEQASYEILLKIQEFEAKKIRIQNNRAQVLGEFKVQDIQFLDLVKRIKLLV